MPIRPGVVPAGSIDRQSYGLRRGMDYNRRPLLDSETLRFFTAGWPVQSLDHA